VRGELLTVLAPLLPEHDRELVLNEALRDARGLTVDRGQARAFIAVARELPTPRRGEVLAEALDAAAEHDSSRGNAGFMAR
jgi:hypothetical protein